MIKITKFKTIIPSHLVGLIQDIEGTDMFLSKFQLPDSKLFPNYNRYLVVTGINVNLDNKYITLPYYQLGIEKDSGVTIKLPLGNPAFTIDDSSWSYLRDNKMSLLKGKKQKLEELTDNAGNPTGGYKIIGEEEEPIKVDTISYMLWMLANKKVHFSDLIGMYSKEFYAMNSEKLNSAV